MVEKQLTKILAMAAKTEIVEQDLRLLQSELSPRSPHYSNT